MTTMQNEPRPATREPHLDDLTAAIADHVLATLGRPADLNRVVVRRLWRDHYRVNVLVGADVTSTTIDHSYFVVADGDGIVNHATPAIIRRYQVAVDGGQKWQVPS